MPTVREFAIEAARTFALPGAKAAYNQCERQSALLHQHLRRMGVDAERRGGEFGPATPTETWHPRWVKLGAPPYVHYWTTVGDMILDPTAAQFGEPDLVVAQVGDPRYEDDGYRGDSRSPNAPLNAKKQDGAICHRHALDEEAIPVTMIAKPNDGTAPVRVCAACANKMARAGAKVSAIRTTVHKAA